MVVERTGSMRATFLILASLALTISATCQDSRAALTEEHAAVLAMMLSLIDSYTAQIDELTARIEVLAEPYLHQIEQLDAVHGTGKIVGSSGSGRSNTNRADSTRTAPRIQM